MAGGDTTRPDGGDSNPGAYPQNGGFADPETGQLELGDAEASLPWLQGDDDEDEYYEGVSAGRLIGLAFLGLLVLVAVGGGGWWLVHKMGTGTPVADGSVIQAPPTPYKEKPENPGGSLVAGTGDTSFVVAEGQSRQMRLGEDEVAPAPSGDKLVRIAQGTAIKDTAATASAAAAAASDAAAEEAPGIGVQVGAYTNRASAEAGWQTLSSHYEALSGVHHRIVEGRADIGTVYRLQAVAGDLAAAQALCRRLKGEGLNCQVKR